MLAVKGIEASYGAIQVLKGVDLEVKTGEIVTLIGANGAGKSTLLDTISGILVPRKGEIIFNGNTDFLSSKRRSKGSTMHRISTVLALLLVAVTPVFGQNLLEGLAQG